MGRNLFANRMSNIIFLEGLKTFEGKFSILMYEQIVHGRAKTKVKCKMASRQQGQIASRELRRVTVRMHEMRDACSAGNVGGNFFSTGVNILSCVTVLF